MSLKGMRNDVYNTLLETNTWLNFACAEFKDPWGEFHLCDRSYIAR
jgi:hypothetical protein